ncbi:MerC domain-containing protein [Pedobacter cryoconitis]|uniref:MerC mercury resistance protein n=1 Tax=Pedobacter cryoconitis TaxID=188932 RepID=A0A327S235_9SPHI|nr:MerC domain-containing protein [Pedobacter cryoconitis]RAJ23089.1 MerC mercury resistance protein [Pedobacter cryoconitis]
MSLSKTTQRLDRLGMTASTLCAVHCALVPIFLTTLPLLGLEFLSNEWVEISMIVVSVLLGTLSLSMSYRKQHHKLLPFMVLFSGFALITIGHFSSMASLEPILIPLGGFTVAAAHLVNWRLNRACTHHDK